MTYPLARLGEVATVVMGQSPRAEFVSVKPGSGLPLLNGPTEFGATYPAARQWASEWTRVAKPADTLFCVRGSTTGRMNVAQIEYAIGRGVAAVRGGSADDTRFLRYALINGLPQLLSLTSGSVFPNISTGDLNGFLIPWPPESARRGIVSKLGPLDEKIESNHRAIALMETLGAALLESELEMDPTGSPPMADGRLGDYLGVLETGSRPKGGVTSDGAGVVSLGAENIQAAGVVATKAFKLVPYEFAESMTRGRLESGDVLVYKDGGTPGNFRPHVSAFGEGFPVDTAMINEHVYRVRASAGISQAALYWILRSTWMDAEMRKVGTGVAIPGLNSSNFKNLPFPSLRDDQVGTLNRSLEPMFSLMLRLGAQGRKLAALRDTLMPELLAARIDTAHTDEVFEEAAG